MQVCAMCSEPVTTADGCQCKGSCKKWYHYKCMKISPSTLQDIYTGRVVVRCPCGSCSSRSKKSAPTDGYLSKNGNISCGDKNFEALEEKDAKHLTKKAKEFQDKLPISSLKCPPSPSYSCSRCSQCPQWNNCPPSLSQYSSSMHASCRPLCQHHPCCADCRFCGSAGSCSALSVCSYCNSTQGKHDRKNGNNQSSKLPVKLKATIPNAQDNIQTNFSYPSSPHHLQCQACASFGSVSQCSHRCQQPYYSCPLYCRPKASCTPSDRQSPPKQNQEEKLAIDLSDCKKYVFHLKDNQNNCKFHKKEVTTSNKNDTVAVLVLNKDEINDEKPTLIEIKLGQNADRGKTTRVAKSSSNEPKALEMLKPNSPDVLANQSCHPSESQQPCCPSPAVQKTSRCSVPFQIRRCSVPQHQTRCRQHCCINACCQKCSQFAQPSIHDCFSNASATLERHLYCEDPQSSCSLPQCEYMAPQIIASCGCCCRGQCVYSCQNPCAPPCPFSCRGIPYLAPFYPQLCFQQCCGPCLTPFLVAQPYLPHFEYDQFTKQSSRARSPARGQSPGGSIQSFKKANTDLTDKKTNNGGEKKDLNAPDDLNVSAKNLKNGRTLHPTEENKENSISQDEEMIVLRRSSGQNSLLSLEDAKKLISKNGGKHEQGTSMQDMVKSVITMTEKNCAKSKSTAAKVANPA